MQVTRWNVGRPVARQGDVGTFDELLDEIHLMLHRRRERGEMGTELVALTISFAIGTESEPDVAVDVKLDCCRTVARIVETAQGRVDRIARVGQDRRANRPNIWIETATFVIASMIERETTYRKVCPQSS